MMIKKHPYHYKKISNVLERKSGKLATHLEPTTPPTILVAPSPMALFLASTVSLRWCLETPTRRFGVAT